MSITSNPILIFQSLPSLSSPNFVSHFQATKDEKMIVHFYECFKNDICGESNDSLQKFNNSKEMMKIIINQRKEYQDKYMYALNVANVTHLNAVREKQEYGKKICDQLIEIEKMKSVMKEMFEKCEKLMQERNGIECQLSSSHQTINQWINVAYVDREKLQKCRQENEELNAKLEKAINENIETQKVIKTLTESLPKKKENAKVVWETKKKFVRHQQKVFFAKSPLSATETSLINRNRNSINPEYQPLAFSPTSVATKTSMTNYRQSYASISSSSTSSSFSSGVTAASDAVSSSSFSMMARMNSTLSSMLKPETNTLFTTF